MLLIITVLGAAVLLLATAYAEQDARNLSRANMAQPRGLPWGYYPGYGWSPLPPAQKHFS
jgi:hypothetical protein